MTAPSRELLLQLRDRLEGEARSFAVSQHDRLSRLDALDLELWAEIADHVGGQRVRNKRALFGVSADGLVPLGVHPGLRTEVHGWARQFTRRSSRLASSFMTLCRDLMGRIPEGDFREIVEWAGELDWDIDVASTFMDYAPAVLARRDIAYVRAWFEGACAVAQVDGLASRGFLEAVAKAAHSLSVDDLPVLAEMGSRVARHSRRAVKGFFQALPALVGDMTTAQLGQWVDTGLQMTSGEDDLVLYLSHGSKRSHQVVEALCRATSFSSFRDRISLVLEAFLGRPAVVRDMYELLDPASVPPDVPAFTKGDCLYVRPTLACGTLPPFALYRLVALHAAAHKRFGSLGERELETMLARGGRPLVTGGVAESSDLDRFLFSIAEDFRIDSALLRTLPGLKADAELIIRETYERPAAESGNDVPVTACEAAAAEAPSPGAAPPSATAPISPALLRAHVAAFPLGVRLLTDAETASLVERALGRLAVPEAGPSDSLGVAAELKAALGGQLMEAQIAAALPAADSPSKHMPHPPYHDHLFLGMMIASLTGGAGKPASTDSLPPGALVDVPGSLHASEVVEGLQIKVRDHQQEADLLILDDEERDEVGDGLNDSFKYHEWDVGIGDYRTDWCTVRYRDVLRGDSSFVGDTIARHRGEVLLIRRQFERLRPDRIRRFFRQQEGDELDLDALVEALTDMKAGAPMTDKVFIRRDKKQRDVAVLFLLDMSDSTDQVVADGQRIIDVEKQGLVLLSEALGQLDDQYAVMGFTSRGRRHVDIFRIKDFHDEFDEGVAGRIAGIEPFDYTRLGAALRHATAHLARVDAGVRLLVLLSDGRPYDMGYGDMRYAMEDTKMALTEATRAGTKVFCITIDPEGPKYLERMFGPKRYTVIQNVSHLPTKLPHIYRNLTV